MPRWVERKGFTLRVPPRRGGEEVAEHYVRISLMERVGLVRGLFNVREARAEPNPDGEGVHLLATGRALSWRWLGHAQAERMLDERMGSLEAMGYTVVDSAMLSRGRWDWLYELVHRRLAHGAAPQALGESPSDSASVRDALPRPGLSPDAAVEGVAAVLGVSEHALAEPNPRTVRQADPGQLGVVLQFLVHHQRAELRSIGERWLQCPAVVYHLDPSTVLVWLESDDRIATLLAPRIADEGLAILGPDAMVRLGRRARPAARAAARRWSQRLG